MQSNLLQEDWKETLATLFSSASTDVLVSSPFVTRKGIDFLVDNLHKSVRDCGNVQVLVNLSPQNIVQGVTEPESLQHLKSTVSSATIHHLPSLHAKVYVADTQYAIVTSGNLTEGGLEKNYEYGIGMSNKAEIIRSDIEEYAGLGVQISKEELSTYIEAAQKARSTLQEQQELTQDTSRQSFEEAIAEARDELIRLRLSGESTNATFAKTILYLLRRKGPMTTKDLHPLIQRIHPDLCDDSIDRIVEGQNYGKRWKHRVRAAQSTLKQRGEIELVDGRWRLAKEG